MTIADPKAPRSRPTPLGRRTTRTNAEAAGWAFMRLSGVVMVVLVLVHLVNNLVVPENGVRSIDFAFVAGRWASPFWQLWDLLLLWVAMMHGANGLRLIINDYGTKHSTRMWLKLLVGVAFLVMVGLGTMVIFTFDPCPIVDGALLDGAPSFCTP